MWKIQATVMPVTVKSTFLEPVLVWGWISSSGHKEVWVPACFCCHVTYNAVIWHLALFNQDFLLVWYKSQLGEHPFVACLIKVYLFCQLLIRKLMVEVVQLKIKKGHNLIQKNYCGKKNHFGWKPLIQGFSCCNCPSKSDNWVQKPSLAKLNKEPSNKLLFCWCYTRKQL